MEIILDIFLTAFIAILFSLLIAKIVSLATGGDSVSGVEEKSVVDVADEIIMEELEYAEKLKVEGFESERKVEVLEYAEKLKVEGFESERKVEFVTVTDDKVDVFEIELAGADQGFKSVKEVECVGETVYKVDESEAGDGEVAGRMSVQGVECVKEVKSLQGTAKKVDDFEAEQAEFGEAKAEVKLDDFVVESKMEKIKIGEIGEEELEADDETKVQPQDVRDGESQTKGLGEEEKEVKLESDGDEDWEGIERSELEKVFLDAAKFVEHKGDLEGLENDVRMELYGLHKIATEGPCRESQPLAFMVSSRSKWNAWQRLGNMNPEAAMEQYIALLSDKVPWWIEDDSVSEHKFDSADQGIPDAMAPDINSLPDRQSSITQERYDELGSATGGGGITETIIFEKQAND